MKNLFVILITSAIILSCKTEKQEETTNKEIFSENEIALNKNQEDLAGIEIGKMQKQIISEVVECSGNIEVPPQSLAYVNAPLGGFVKDTKFYVGNYVNKGTVLAILEHQNYIQLQQKYLETKSELEFYREEFKRQGELTIEDASSMKKMQKAKADFGKIEASFLSLQSQLKMIGINPEDIKSTGMKSTIEILAPINGYISKINANIGKYMNENEPLYEIMNNDHLQLLLKIFENDIQNIKTGQRIKFSVPGNIDKTFEATVNTIGQNVDEEERSINIYAHLLHENNNLFKAGMFVNASIQLSNNSVYVLPSTAIINSGNSSFVFVKYQDRYKKTQIEKGIEQNNFIQISKPAENLINAEIVTKGAYYLNAEIENIE